MDSLAHTNVNSLWGYTLAQTLARLGVRQAVVSPGSRSTPILWALAHSEIEALPVLDERAAAFFALGLAKASGRPVVLACTSGTAAANYLPALVEAHESGVPLLVLTADRPKELSGCAAGQAVDQVKLYGSYVNEYIELPVPEPTSACLRHLRETLGHALRRTMLPWKGPVHVNCPLREPLAPQPGKTLPLDFDPDKLLEGLAPQRYAPPTPDAANLALPREVCRGLIVAGTTAANDDAAARAALWNLASRTGWPVLADCLGPWRAGKVPQGVVRIGAYDAILADAANRKRLAPDFVLQIGPLPTSKNLRAFLAALDLPTLVAAPTPANLDPLHVRAEAVDIAPEKLDLLPLPAATDATYAATWAELDRSTGAALNASLDAENAPTGGAIARALHRILPENARLFIANSLSVRHAESFAECGHAPYRIFFNRGANGIDGTIATALGASHGAKGVLLTGDLAFLYDAGSLAVGRQMKGSLTIVLADNHGGGIFGHLPVAALGDPAYEKYFATPQDTDIAKLAEAYGASFEDLATVAELAERLGTLPDSGIRILRLKTPTA